MTRNLVHWTCADGAAGIRRDAAVKPRLGMSWWTDLDKPGRRTRAALGLTSHTLTCDRMTFLCRPVDPGLLVPWQEVSPTVPLLAAALEIPDGAMPGHWWVATEPVPVRSVRRIG